MVRRSPTGIVFTRVSTQLMTAEEALAALDRGDPIHVSGEEMRRFVSALTVRRSVMTEQPHGCRHNATPDLWKDEVPYCRKCGADMSAGYEMGD